MIALIDNYDSFTYNIYQYLSQLTAEEIGVFRNDRISVDELSLLHPSHVIISPGPGRPEDAGISLEVVRRCAGSIPIFGVCLGLQAIAAAFGAKIIHAQHVIHGKREAITFDGNGLFRTLAPQGACTRYHSLAVDKATVPPELEITATAADGEIMGMRHREHICEGVQFHPEFCSSPLAPHPLFVGFLGASIRARSAKGAKSEKPEKQEKQGKPKKREKA